MVETTFKVTLPIGLKKLLEEVGSSIVSAECLEYLPEDARMNLIAGVLLERKAQSIVRLRESNGRVQRELRESAVQKPEVKLEPQAEQKVEKKAKKPKAPQAVPFTLEQLPGESQLAFLRRKIPEYINNLFILVRPDKNGDFGLVYRTAVDELLSWYRSLPRQNPRSRIVRHKVPR